MRVADQLIIKSMGIALHLAKRVLHTLIRGEQLLEANERRFSEGLDMKVPTRADYIGVHSLYEKRREKENGKS